MEESQPAGLNETLALSRVLINLFKGTLYADDNKETWTHLLDSRPQVNDYLKVLGLKVFVDEAEGFAFLRQQDAVDEDERLPRLIQRRPLGFEVSVLSVLLRKWLLEHDARGQDSRAIVTRERIHEELSLFMANRPSEAKISDRIDSYIKRVCELGLLRELKGDGQRLEIMRITKALINPEWLGDLDERLSQYRNCGQTEEGKGDE